MLVVYLSLGGQREEFLRLTPYQYHLELRGAEERLKREGRDRTELAWTTAHLSRAKNIPKLKDLLSDKPKKRREQTHDEIVGRLLGMTANMPKKRFGKCRQP